VTASAADFARATPRSASARALYGAREHPGEDMAKIILASWL